MLMGYYIISLIFPEMKVSPEEELSLFSSSGCPPQLLLFVPPSGLFPVRTTTSSTELQPLTAQPTAPPLVTLHSSLFTSTHRWNCIRFRFLFLLIVSDLLHKTQVKSKKHRSLMHLLRAGNLLAVKAFKSVFQCLNVPAER